ncbi:MAG TPA: DUF3592 domain-containing protein [Terracidiphilus sp.]|nr:DUF3592 domain-containing protein [Terracidiphilus sp.]
MGRKGRGQLENHAITVPSPRNPTVQSLAHVTHSVLYAVLKLFLCVLLLLFGAITLLIVSVTRRMRHFAKVRSSWNPVSAVIEVVFVTDHSLGEKRPLFLCRLTYFYRNPDLQTGDYTDHTRRFLSKGDASRWGAQFKGRTVTVRVNPASPADSILLQEDIAGLDRWPVPQACSFSVQK